MDWSVSLAYPKYVCNNAGFVYFSRKIVLLIRIFINKNQ